MPHSGVGRNRPEGVAALRDLVRIIIMVAEAVAWGSLALGSASAARARRIRA